MSARRRKALVAGAGVAGLAAAVWLRRAGLDVEVWEPASSPGGLLRPFAFRGLPCDLGSHRLHPDALADPLIRELAGPARLVARPRRGRIVLAGGHVAYPLTPSGLLRGLGPVRAASFAAGFARRRPLLSAWEHDRCTAEDIGFEAFVRRRVGSAAYEGFYRPYAEKVWGMPARDLSQTVAKKRLSTARPHAELARAALSPFRRGDTYLYPEGGLGALVSALHDLAVREGARFRWGQALDPALADADAVLYSGPLRDLAPQTGLRHRGLYLVYLALPGGPVSDTETWYTPERDLLFGRVSELGNYSKRLRIAGETTLCLEIPEGAHGPGVDFTARTDELVAQLRRAGIVPPHRASTVLEVRQVFLRDVYPIYDRGWMRRWTCALDTAAGANVLPIGRQGLFLHCNIDHCVRIAREAAAHVARGGSARSWAEGSLEYATLRVRD